MQILSIHLKNIKSHRDTSIDFSAGINVLSGPNGVGKSTIFEAIGYALFGVDARDFVSNVERFLTIGTKRGEISVTFQTNEGDIWQATRTVGAPTKWLLARSVGGTFEVEEHAKIEETEARIAELLGLDNGRPLADQFKLVIGPFQNDFLGPFIIKQPTKRQEAFDEILGIDAWRKTYKGTSAMLSALQEKVKILTAEITEKQERLAVLPSQTAELTQTTNDLVTRKQSISDKEAVLVTVEARVVELDAAEKAVIALANELQLLESRIKDGSGKTAEQKLRINESVQAKKIVEESKAGKEAFDRIEMQLAELRQKEQQRRTIEQEIVALEKNAQKLGQKLEHERSEIQNADKQLDADLTAIHTSRTQLQPDTAMTTLAAQLPDLRKQIDLLKGQRSLLDGRRESLQEGKEKLAEGVCPFFQEQCHNIAGSQPRDVFSTRLTDLEQQAADLDRQLTQLATHCTDAEKAEKEITSRSIRLQELDKQEFGVTTRREKNRERQVGLETIKTQHVESLRNVETRKEALAVFGNIDAAIISAEQERQQHQATRDAYTANLNVAQDLDSRQQRLQKMELLLADLTKEQKEKQIELAKQQSGFQPELLHQVRSEKEQLLADVAGLKQQVVDLDKNAKRLTVEIEKLQKVQADIEAKQAECASCAEKEKLVKFLRNQVFKNVSTQLSERFREEISLRADRIYRTIAESDEELYWGDNYQIVLKDMYDGNLRERTDDQLSGGQMMSAVVALRLALLQTIGARIAFFDEPTSNLDATRRENLAQAFRAIDVGREEVTEHWYDQLFLVSHDVAFTEITDQMINLGES